MSVDFLAKFRNTNPKIFCIITIHAMSSINTLHGIRISVRSYIYLNNDMVQVKS